jgi:hypothetical protein
VWRGRGGGLFVGRGSLVEAETGGGLGGVLGEFGELL